MELTDDFRAYEVKQLELKQRAAQVLRRAGELNGELCAAQRGLKSFAAQYELLKANLKARAKADPASARVELHNLKLISQMAAKAKQRLLLVAERVGDLKKQTKLQLSLKRQIEAQTESLQTKLKLAKQQGLNRRANLEFESLIENILAARKNGPSESAFKEKLSKTTSKDKVEAMRSEINASSPADAARPNLPVVSVAAFTADAGQAQPQQQNSGNQSSNSSGQPSHGDAQRNPWAQALQEACGLSGEIVSWQSAKSELGDQLSLRYQTANGKTVELLVASDAANKIALRLGGEHGCLNESSRQQERERISQALRRHGIALNEIEFLE